MRATTSGANSAYTNVSSAITLPATPTGLTASIVNGSRVDLAWTDWSGIETSYSIEQWDNVSSQWHEVQTSAADTESLSVHGIFEPTIQYKFRVRAYDADLDIHSAPSNEATATALGWPAAPTDLTMTPVSNTEIDLVWIDKATNENGYTIEQTTDGENWTLLTPTPLPANTQSYQVTGLTDGSLYGYRVHAVNAVGGSGYADNVDATLPTAPANLQATVVSGTEIDLTWTAAPYATSYTIWQRAEFDSDWSLVTNSVPSSQTSYAVTGLAAGGVYYAFCVAPTNSTAGSAVAYVDPPTVNLPPNVATPTVGASPVTTTNTTLSVQGSDERPESTLTYSWSIVSAPSAGGAYFSLNDSNTAKNTTVTFYAGGNFTFQVTVTDAGGLSAASNVTINVQQTLTGINVTPHDAAVLKGTTRQFAATAVDQFGNNMTNQTSFTWAANGGVGSINASGLYAAPSSGNDSSFTVSASSGGKTGSANVAFKKGDGNSEDVSLVSDAQPPANPVYTPKYVNLSSYHGITRIVVTNLDPAGLDYDDFSFDTPNGHVVINFNELADGTTVANQYQSQGATFLGGIVSHWWSDDLQVGSDHVYMPPAGWTGPLEVQFSFPVENLHFKITAIDTSAPTAFATVTVYKDAPRLLELTVADHNNTDNKATAIDAAIRELYVPEDETNHSAEVGISTLFDPSHAANKIHLKVQRDDGWIVADDQVTTLDKILQVTEQARVFTITAWLDKNGNNQFDSGVDEQEQIKVHVKKPWTSQGTWTVGNAAIVKANADGASLQQLALDITGNAADASLLGNIGKITKDKQIDVTALLKKLEERTRTNVVAAAGPATAKNLIWRGIGSGGTGNVATETQIKAVFLGGGPPTLTGNCATMTMLELSYGLITQLNSGEFDKLGIKPRDFFSYSSLQWPHTPALSPYMTNRQVTLSGLQPGDWARFWNNGNYRVVQGNRAMFGSENVIVVGNGSMYFGWCEKPQTLSYTGWLQQLRDEYNRGLGWWDRIGTKDVEGYSANTAGFINIPKIGQMIFNLRTGQAP
ncbi:MAG: fibronectin type III domain-containing protein [Pirellulaceae bacterium]|nr:fibronectin type III domain-containing protein [Pirellulaceae bacterium]